MNFYSWHTDRNEFIAGSRELLGEPEILGRSSIAEADFYAEHRKPRYA